MSGDPKYDNTTTPDVPLIPATCFPRVTNLSRSGKISFNYSSKKKKKKKASTAITSTTVYEPPHRSPVIPPQSESRVPNLPTISRDLSNPTFSQCQPS